MISRFCRSGFASQVRGLSVPGYAIPKGEQMNSDISNFLVSFPFAASTRRTYADVLSRVLGGSQDLSNIRAAELLELIESSGWGNKRQCLALAAVQKFLRWKYGSHPALSAKIKRVVGKPQPALSPDDALRLLASFNGYSATGARNLALCALGIDTGLRASEICRVETKYVDLGRGVLKVIVKGGQWQAAIFCPATAAYIDRWLTYRGVRDGVLFPNIFTGAALTPEGLNQLMRQWGLRIGIHLSPHMLRRSGATYAALLGANESALMLGWRWDDPSMPKLYTHTLQLEAAMRPYSPVQGLLDGRIKMQGVS